jgi:hypothetical protein
LYQSWENDNILPTRLLDIGTHKTDVIRIIHGQERRSEYATLSHCWGRGLHIQSIKSTIVAFTREFPWEELSKTFKDAVIIARGLGICYLWIDSLCIIHGDYNDWERECPTAKVYSQAIVNICASSAKDGNDGCFLPRQPFEESIRLNYGPYDGKCLFISKPVGT